MVRNPEKALFSILLIISLVPLFLPAYFITLDGPAHLYNARLIRDLFSGNPLVNHFFTWNPVPEPNWSGHFLMAILGFIFSPALTMKLTLAMIMVAGAYGFRRLLKITAPGKEWLSWLIFPWLWNFPLMMGFLNYSIAVSLMLWMWVTWIRLMNSPNRHQWIILLLLCILSYFSHLMVFAITLVGMLLLLWGQKDAGKKFISLVLLSLPFVIAGLSFIVLKGTSGMHESYKRLPFDELIANMTNARALIVYHYDNEKPFGRLYAIFIAIIFLYSLFTKSANPYRKVAGVFALLMLILHFSFPDDFASGGIITVRLAQLCFMAWLWWIALSDIPGWMQKSSALFSVLIAILFFSQHYSINKELSAETVLYTEAASHIPAGSVVLPLNHSTNWLHSNLHGYAAAENNLLFLDNYEADMKHFPLHWNVESPEITYGKFASSITPCIYFDKLAEKKLLPDAVLSWFPFSSDDSCTKAVREDLAKYYNAGYENRLARVYLRK